MSVHLIEYTACTANGIERGVARVHSPNSRPNWSEAADQIPDFCTGTYIGPELQYTLTYATAKGQTARTISGTKAVSTIGAVVNRAADRGEAWDVKVTDQRGADVTFDFACFR